MTELSERKVLALPRVEDDNSPLRSAWRGPEEGPGTVTPPRQVHIYVSDPGEERKGEGLQNRKVANSKRLQSRGLLQGWAAKKASETGPARSNGEW